MFDYTRGAWGDLYVAPPSARGTKDDYARAAAAFEQAYARRGSLRALVGIGFARKEMGDAPAALRAFLEALAVPPPPEVVWGLHEQVAALYAATGDAARARGHAADALRLAPVKDRPALEARLRASGAQGGP